MRDNYDFSNSIQNPYVKTLKKEVTLQLDDVTLDFFKQVAEEQGTTYQNLIYLYLQDCAKEKRELTFSDS
ncbi:antitoxin [Okeania sp. SIO2G5]|uniref:antitoxin n=1 Tax=Okeania sp. SIO2G5 TaxID=2607796 RepID=UPI0013C152D6|nr:antitoxin [Okeania sp. SIO2G5]NEP76283.1 antitoxin [Okeania sp. SIO2G5]